MAGSCVFCGRGGRRGWADCWWGRGLQLQVWLVGMVIPRGPVSGRGQPAHLEHLLLGKPAAGTGADTSLPPSLSRGIEGQRGEGLGRKKCCPLTLIAKLTSEDGAGGAPPGMISVPWPLAPRPLCGRIPGLTRPRVPLLSLPGRPYP